MNAPMQSGTEATCKHCGEQCWVPADEDPNDTLCAPCADARDAGEED